MGTTQEPILRPKNRPRIKRVINIGSVQSLVQLKDKRYIFVDTKSISKKLIKEFNKQE